MKNINMKFFKENTKTRLLLVCSAILISIVSACTENDEIVYGAEDEPFAAVGFKEAKAELVEGDLVAFDLEVGSSKAVFSDISFDLAVVSGNASEVILTDNEGNSGPTFTLPAGEKTLRLSIKIADNNVATSNRTVTYKLQNLVGDRVFLTESNISGGDGVIAPEFEITISDDD